MNNRILAELDFASILNESKAQTATGADLLRKYQSFLITNYLEYYRLGNCRASPSLRH